MSVEGDTVRGEYWVDDQLRGEKHSEGFGKALDDALDQIPNSWRGEIVTATFAVHIKEHPGSVDGYFADLTPGG